VIALESVSKRFGAKTIVHDLTFTVEKGEIVGFLGPNGAGKTTTMRMIAGFTTASSGRVTVAGYDMATQNEQAARKIGYVPEHPPLYDTLEVTQYLRFVARVKGIPRSQFRAELDRVAAACRLEAVLDRRSTKSPGYRQRLGLAQALLGGRYSAGRAHGGARPGADPGNPGGHPLLRRATRSTAEHPHPAGGHLDLRAGRHHQPGPPARHRLA
jgi:ABC-2 type transport system ATP-binding protein